MAMQTQSELGEIDAAIAEALKIRSPAARRHQLAILYAKAKRGPIYMRFASRSMIQKTQPIQHGG